MLPIALLKTVVGALLCAGVSLRYAGGVYVWHVSNKLEKPRYQVLRRLQNGVEIRAYEEYVIAEAEFDAPPSMKNATGDGFREIARYVFGANRARRRWGRRAAPVLTDADDQSQKMAMTAPVRTEMTETSAAGGSSLLAKVKVSFVMSSNYSLGNLPIPASSAVRLRRIPPHRAAFVKFSGPPPSPDLVSRKRAGLLRELEASGYGLHNAAVDATTLIYGYHDPFVTPNILRKNEVGIMLK